MWLSLIFWRSSLILSVTSETFSKAISTTYVGLKMLSILCSDNNKEIVLSYKAQILSVIRNEDSLALGMVQIFAQIDARTFSHIPL